MGFLLLSVLLFILSTYTLASPFSSTLAYHNRGGAGAVYLNKGKKPPGLFKMFKSFWSTLFDPTSGVDDRGPRKKGDIDDEPKGKRRSLKPGKGRKLGG